MKLRPPLEVRSRSTRDSTAGLLSSLAQGYRIESIVIQVWGQQFSRITVKIEKDGSSPKEIVSLNEPEFTEHVTRYKNLPIPGTSKAQFVYLDNPNEYEEVSAQFWEFVAGRSKAIVAMRDLGIPTHLKPIFLREVLRWIADEGKMPIAGERAPRLFIDSCLIFVRQHDIDITTLSREFLDAEDLQLLRTHHTRMFLLSPLWLSPKYPKQGREKFVPHVDPLLGFCLIDIRLRTGVCLGLATIRQCLAAYGTPLRNDVSQFISEMVKESLSGSTALTTLKPPALNSDYTPIPWITFACINEQSQRILERSSNYCLTIPEFLALGYPGFPGQFNSFEFSRPAQRAAVNMKFTRSKNEMIYNLRFDLSPAQPVLHVDFQIFAPGQDFDRKKLLDHSSVMLEDLWKENRILYLGFLAAGGYDSYFDSLIEHGLEGFHRISYQNASSGYPLMMRVHVKPKEDWLHANLGHLKVLTKIAADGFNALTVQDRKLIPELVSQQLFRDKGLTLLGEMLATRLRDYIPGPTL
jgi:hypothetical protein